MDNKAKSSVFQLPEKIDYMIFSFCLIVKKYNVQEYVHITPYTRLLKFYMYKHKTTQLLSLHCWFLNYLH